MQSNPSGPPTGPYATAPDDGVSLPPPERNWRTPWWLWILGPVMLVAVVLMQRPATMSAQQVSDLQNGRVVEPPGSSPEIAIAKVLIAYHGKQVLGVDLSSTLEPQLDPPTGFGVPPKAAQERFRTALVLAKVGKSDVSATRLDTLEKEIDASSVLHQDIATARDPGHAGAKALDDFKARHGWFARIYLDDGSAGELDKAKSQGEQFLRVIGVASLVMVLLLLGGMAAIVVLTGMLMSGAIKPWPIAHAHPSQPDSRGLWLETVIVFIGGFLTLKLGSIAVLALAPNIDVQYVVWGTLLAQWLLVLTLFWPRVRGMSKAQHRAEAGWHKGRGVFKEMGAGMLAYLAMVPLYFLLAIVIVIGMLVYYAARGEPPPQMENKVVDLASGGGAEMIAVVLLATIWAPIVEETIFRGALFRYLRPRWGLVVAAIGSAAVFAGLHGYLIPQLLLVGTLGFCFALLREWRNSLIGSMTAHAFHNGMVFLFISQLAPVMQG